MCSFKNTTPTHTHTHTLRSLKGILFPFQSYKTVLPLIFIFLLITPLQAQDFINGDFESDLICNPTDCEENEISCIEGWYQYFNQDPYYFAWYRYSCEEQPIAPPGATPSQISSLCNFGERGLWLQDKWFTADEKNPMTVMTENPYYNDNPNAIYKIEFDLIAYWMGSEGNLIIDVSGATSLNATTKTYLNHAVSFAADYPECEKMHKKLYFDYNQEVLVSANITDFPYLVFSANTTSIPPANPPGAYLSSRGIIDNVSICKMLELIVNDHCDNFCITTSYNETCSATCSSEDCSFALLAFDSNNDYVATETPFEDNFVCSEVPASTEPVAISMTMTGGEIPDAGLVISFYHFLNDCAQYETNLSSTQWDNQANVPNDGKFQNITIKTGHTLTIGSNVEILFCEGGKLIVEKGAILNLYGTLTSNCPFGWEGVEVQGDGTTNQYPVGGLFPQGTINCFEGSLIENALIGVKLYGPNVEDAGGIIYADGASFLNNSRSIHFEKFNNYFFTPSKQKPYQSSIRDCNFNIDDHYILTTVFKEHIKMHGIFGIHLNGNYFGNDRIFDNPYTSKIYGVGITAIEAGFNVGATALNIIDEPCLPSCNEKNRSKFFGLAVGVAVFSGMRNRPFQVYNAEFTNCFTGISNEMVSGANILFNDFNMGSVNDLKFQQDQIGISLSGVQHIGAIQENTFSVSPGIADFTCGIVCNGIGAINNKIRRNSFDGLDVGNEAFDINGNGDNFEARGLIYLCNENTNVVNSDFYVRHTDASDLISQWQGLYSTEMEGIEAAGNTFSESGNLLDGDFANYGDMQISYYYNENVPLEIPDISMSVGITAIDRDETNCQEEFCLHPCIDQSGFSSEVNSYYSNLSDYEYAKINNDLIEQSFYRLKMDSCLSNIIRFIEYDTSSTYIRDTLRSWYSRMDAIAGDLMLAGDFFEDGNEIQAFQTLDSISSKYNLDSNQVIDIGRVRDIYTILSSRSYLALTAADINTLTLYSNGNGASYSLSRGVLALLDTFFTPRYYVPGEILPRTIDENDFPVINSNEIKVYPNPVGDILMVDIQNSIIEKAEMKLYSIDGRLINTYFLNSGTNSINLAPTRVGVNGVCLYHITTNDGIIKQGKLILMR